MYLPQGFFLFLSPGAASSSLFRPTKNGLFFRKWTFCAIFYILRSFCRPLVLGRQGPQHRRLNFIHVENELFYFLPFLPAAKLTCHRKVRVVVVGGGLLWGYAGRPKVKVKWSTQPLWFALFPLYPTHNFLQVGSVNINQELSLLDQIFLLGGGSVTSKRISLQGGIRHSLNRFLFGVGSLAPISIYLRYTMAFVGLKSLRMEDFWLVHFYYKMLCMPQVFEQSLFLFCVKSNFKCRIYAARNRWWRPPGPRRRQSRWELHNECVKFMPEKEKNV